MKQCDYTRGDSTGYVSQTAALKLAEQYQHFL